MLRSYRNKNLVKFLQQLVKEGLWMEKKLFFKLDMGETNRNLGRILGQGAVQTMIAILRS